MDPESLDHPLIRSILFYPVTDRPGGSAIKGAVDGTIPVDAGVSLGYRLYPRDGGGPVVLYFHGNGEVASDYDDLAPAFFGAGASLMVVDYRGYGWSSGTPSISTLEPDSRKVGAALPEVLRSAGIGGAPVILMGRSLGSAPAIHLAYTEPERYKGLIVESGFAELIPVLLSVGVPPELLAGARDPAGNLSKIANIHLPLLVIHGERDNLIPVSHGQSLYDASPAAHKHILRVPGAGHNDLTVVALEQYFEAIGAMIRHVIGPE